LALTIFNIRLNATSLVLSAFIKNAVFLIKISALAFSLSTQAASPFTTEGKFSVGSDGSANYSIPIVVPPGTAGMQPQLALNYSSNGGNGIVGMGWGIDGLSQISRCPTTLEQDGVINGVTYTNTDRFCIDGQRLIATTDSYVTNPSDSTKKIYSTTSAYGTNGTEYRTESANFAKIVSYGVAGTGPAYFKVWTKSGQIIEYGNTADSGIEAQGKAAIRTWGVNKISDTKGNYITVTYTEDNANGEAYVSRIDYTGNASSAPALTPYANVQFVYEARPDTTTIYQAGSVLKTTKRLTTIQAYSGTNLIKSYKLTYSNTGAYHTNTNNAADGTLLASVQECDGSATPGCKQTTSLTWVPGTVSTSPFSAAQTWPGLPAGATIVATGDVNGDGLADVIYQTETPATSYLYPVTLNLAISTGSGFSNVGIVGSQSVPCAISSGYGGCQQYFKASVNLADVNGDGRADFINKNTVSLSVGSGFSTAQNWGITNMVASSDVNGDGLADVIYQTETPATSNLYPVTLNLAISTGSGFSNVGTVGSQSVPCAISSGYGGCQQYHSACVKLSDLNNDGLAELVNKSFVSLSVLSIPDQLTSLASGGIVSSVIYNKLSAGGLYVADATSAYPVRDIAISYPIYVVSSSSVSDGLGGVVTTNYQYGGLKAHLRGRGSLGFRYVKESSPDSGIAVTTFYRQDFPFIGLPSQVEKRRLSDNALLSVVQNSYVNTDLTTGTMLSKFPYLSQSVEQAYELDGSLVSTTTTSNQYDGYGNVTTVQVDDGVGNIKTTTSTYNNDVGNWLLGRLVRSAVTSNTP